jgi:adenylate cyclase class 2
MAIEVELKARIDDPEKTKAAVGSFARYVKDFDKQDAYWYSFDGKKVAVRVRRETSGAESRNWVTFKTKTLRDIIEVNDEKEFSVSDEKPFEELLALFGMRVGIRKRKKGWAWTFEHITIELAEVEKLGWFAELEILLDENEDAAIADARSRLLAVLRKLEIPVEKIETRYYTELLRSLEELEKTQLFKENTV